MGPDICILHKFGSVLIVLDLFIHCLLSIRETFPTTGMVSYVLMQIHCKSLKHQRSKPTLTKSHPFPNNTFSFSIFHKLTYLFLLWTRNFLAEFKPLGLPLPIFGYICCSSGLVLFNKC